MLSCAAVLLLAAFTAAEGLPKTECNFSVDYLKYIYQLIDVADINIKAGNVSVSYEEYTGEFSHKNKSYVLEVHRTGLASSFPSLTVSGKVLYWGNSSIFHMYTDFLFGNHTQYYTGRVGTPGNLTEFHINVTKTNYTMSTYKRFNKNGTNYNLTAHILDPKEFGHHHYSISIPKGPQDLVHRVRRFIEEVELKRLRDYTLLAFKAYSYVIIDFVDIRDYITYC
ncbi:uncharacterized protein LOC134539592 [Bacillus rossius redtenbacheri]|uniref:uncharacterized protein LOC134539592 n=1 Tax=Bacillus rossius redtenbacheri TaxID=93214 RepID=UPI002FDEFF56